MLTRRTLGLSTAAFVLASGLAGSALAQQKTTIEFWHGLPQPLGGQLEQIVQDFNASQDKVQVNPSFKGSYPETMQAAIAAFRAGNAPHIVQMFEVGTATMMAAGPAIKPVYQLMAETGAGLDPAAYIPAVRGYYSSRDGKMMALPFNSSTSIMFYNKDAFQKAGLDPEKAPATWPEMIEAMKKLKASGVSCAFTTSWPTWIQLEQLGSLHDTPFASKSNGFGGLDAELKINAPLFVKHLDTLVQLQKDGLFKYGGRDNKADALFPSGECAIAHASSGLRSRISKEAKFNWGAAPLPYWPEFAKDGPKNGIIGGAAFWVMTSPKRTPAEYKAVSEFFSYLARPQVDAKWHMDTGYVPVTLQGFQQAQASGFYDKNPGADVPAKQLTRTPTTENSMGLRLGNLPEIRNIIQEEMEKAFQGEQTARQALDNSVKRGNTVLRNFERANKG
ncbi:sn-glycerol-3-phosphate ABC transporter substrate-binding protein UgpB [Azospirillum thermophilum]|uniref:sn-glycerol-3-phosphate-binding periplasmic protein UgpB n=1 Tax=Azospirillum thermophilum TaxID=2202148 RepID=A0A2S2CT71_9PROT|nr:sn-glycerol-3-phosphate ABC transporter substrate-binding protein UgpB [Azospirillum thermophilum]AWK87669.1 sn-glycerol-3-phosphate ABC transporter substrate-binding protein UgpB [Azospirillum thermophilum]